MSMISYASGARFINLLGGEMLVSMIGMQTYLLHRHKFGENKRMYQNQVTGLMLLHYYVGLKCTVNTYA